MGQPPDHVVDAIHARLTGTTVPQGPVRLPAWTRWRRLTVHVLRTAEIGCLMVVVPSLVGPIVGAVLAEIILGLQA